MFSIQNKEYSNAGDGGILETAVLFDFFPWDISNICRCRWTAWRPTTAWPPGTATAWPPSSRGRASAAGTAPSSPTKVSGCTRAPPRVSGCRVSITRPAPPRSMKRRLAAGWLERHRGHWTTRGAADCRQRSRRPASHRTTTTAEGAPPSPPPTASPASPPAPRRPPLEHSTSRPPSSKTSQTQSCSDDQKVAIAATMLSSDIVDFCWQTNKNLQQWLEVPVMLKFFQDFVGNLQLTFFFVMLF